MFGVDDTEQEKANPKEVRKYKKKILNQTYEDKINNAQSTDKLGTSVLKPCDNDLIGNRHKYTLCFT